MKRAHLKLVATGKAVVRDIAGMTPARYDVLCLIRQTAIQFSQKAKVREFMWTLQNDMYQDTIRKRLALHPSTISKLLARLEEMGWIRRYRDYDDRRLKIVALTEVGLKKIWQAMRLVWRQRVLLEPFEALARQLWPTLHVLAGLDRTWEIIDAIADRFGDTATAFYDWGSQWHAPPHAPYGSSASV